MQISEVLLPTASYLSLLLSNKIGCIFYWGWL